jgi:hypothetical protein
VEWSTKIAKPSKDWSGGAALANKRAAIVVKLCHSNQRTGFGNNATRDCLYRKFRILVHSLSVPRLPGGAN